MVDDLLQEMIDPTPPRTDVSRWRRLGATAAIFALAGIGVTSLTTNALFTDRETTAGDLLTGTVDLSLGSFSFTMPQGGMAPGDVVVQPISVNNTGSLALRYAVSFLATRTTSSTPDPTNSAGTGVPGAGDLRSALALSVFHVTDANACTATTPVPTDPTVAGTQQSLVVSDYTPILGSPEVGPQTGDSEILGGGTNTQTLCVRLAMDPASTNDFQNTAANVSLRFDAEQVVNNTGSSTPTQ
jgi:hypothetical protein